MVSQLSKLASSSTLSAPALSTPGKSPLGFSHIPALSRRAGSAQLATAKLLGSFPGKAAVKDSVGRGNPTDFMRVDLTANSRMQLVLTNRSSTRINTVLLDADGRAATLRDGKSLTVAGGAQGETVFKGLRPGTYYLRVKSAAKGTNRYEASLFVNRAGGPAPLPCGCGV